jgi:hypothetical protein
MNPLSGVLDEAWRMYRAHAAHLLTIAFVIILIVVDIVLGLIFFALPVLLRSGLSTVISGTLIAPFIALVVTLIYYRLSAAQGDQGPATSNPGGGFNAA